MRKRLLSMFCVLAFSLFSLPGTVLAKENTSIPKHLTISTADELVKFAAMINDGTYTGENTVDMLVELTADIDMKDYDWTPIVASTTASTVDFRGIFDGNDHTINNLYIDNKTENGSWLGLFGGITGDIRDVHVTGEFYDLSSGTSGYYFGPVVGFTNGDVIGCTAEFTVHGENEKLQGQIIGGVAGFVFGPDGTSLTMVNCASYSTICGESVYSVAYNRGAYVGGVAGAIANTETINCRNNGEISISGKDILYLGGITGQTQSGAVLDHCINYGDIISPASQSAVSIGGICGRVSSSSQFICCTNNGALSASDNTDGGLDIGGIVGSVYYGVTNAKDCLIESCLNNGRISGDDNADVSGIVAWCGSSGTVSVKTSISLGELLAEEDTNNVHPIGAANGSSTLEIADNYYDNNLLSQGTAPNEVTAGSTGKPITELETEAFIQQVNSEGGYFRLDENKHIEVIPLQYQLTVVDSYAANSGEGLHEENEVVTIDAGNRPGYRFIGWTATSGTITDSSASRTTFIMPDENATVTASWQYVPPTTYPPTVEQPEEGGTVEITPSSPSQGQWVTITPNPDLGFEVGEVTVTDSSGNQVDVIDNEDGTYKFCQPGSRVTISVTFVRKSLPFADVEEGAWYYDAVHYVYFHEIMTGTSATTFEPNTTLSRAMVAQILYNLEGQPTVTDESTFTDVNGHWAADPIAWAQQTGVVNGYENNTFRPNQAVTREELAQMLYNYTQYKEILLPALGDLSKFPDGSKVSSWAQTAMKWATGLQVINGYEDNTLRPSGNTTRAEAASMIMGLATTLTK